jgi:hypothetical protein
MPLLQIVALAALAAVTYTFASYILINNLLMEWSEI